MFCERERENRKILCFGFFSYRSWRNLWKAKQGKCLIVYKLIETFIHLAQDLLLLTSFFI
jgi:hypothetical protein